MSPKCHQKCTQDFFFICGFIVIKFFFYIFITFWPYRFSSEFFHLWFLCLLKAVPQILVPGNVSQYVCYSALGRSEALPSMCCCTLKYDSNSVFLLAQNISFMGSQLIKLTRRLGQLVLNCCLTHDSTYCLVQLTPPLIYSLIFMFQGLWLFSTRYPVCLLFPYFILSVQNV